MALQHEHLLLSLCSLVVLEPPSLSVFVSVRSPLHSAFWRTSEASPWEQTQSWRLRSAPASTARSRGGRRSAAYRGWSGTSVWTLCFWRSAQSPPSECGRSPSLARPWTPPPTQQTSCCCNLRLGTAGRVRAAALSLCGPAGERGRWGTLGRTSGGNEPGRPGSSATRSWPGLHRVPAGPDASGLELHGSSLGVQSLSQCAVSECLMMRWSSAHLRSQLWNSLRLMVQTCGDQGLTKVSLHWTPTATCKMLQDRNVRKCFRHAVPQFHG